MISYLLFGAGLVFLVLGGDWLVKGAVGLAERLGIPPLVIGLTIVALGTSMPELVISLDAALTDSGDLAVGNVVGSNIFNILWILGLTASINDLPFNVISNFDIIMVVVATLLILLAVVSHRGATITRPWGAAFGLMYVAYIVYVVQRI